MIDTRTVTIEKSDLAKACKCAAGPWQPIDTAPRTYTPILGLYRDNVALCWYNKDTSRFETNNDEFDSACQPTYWAKLNIPEENQNAEEHHKPQL